MNFKEWLQESTARKRASMGIYPHYPSHAFAYQPYSYQKFLDFIRQPGVKTHNIKKSRKGDK